MTGDLHCHTTLSDGSLGIEAFRMGQEAQFKSTHSLLCTAEARQAGRSLPEVMPDKKRLCKGNDRKGNGKISYPCRRCTALHEKLKEHF